MLRPFWCNDSTTTLRTLDDWPGIHGDLSLSPDTHEGTFAVSSNDRQSHGQAAGAARQVTVVRAQSRRRTRFSMMPHRRHRGAPRVIAALAGLVHDRESAADYEHNHDKNSY